MKNWNLRNIVERALWTFAQAAVGSLPMTLTLTSSALSGVGWSALSAGLAALIALAKNLTAEGIVVQSTLRAAAAPTFSVSTGATGTVGTAVVTDPSGKIVMNPPKP